MTLAIKIGAGSQVYDNVALANSMRGNQKLSIVGTGEEIKAALSDINTVAANVGSIKATNDLNLSTTQIDTYKAALIKLGTKSIVLDTATTAANIKDYFSQLDAVYTKIKSITLFDPTNKPAIAVEKLATAVNLGGLEVLAGQNFNVTGTDVTIKANMDSLLKNISKINKITIATGSSVEFTAAQLSVLGDKLEKAGTAKVILTDTANNVLTTSSLSLINRLNNTNINSASNVATISSLSGNVITSVAAHGFNTGDAITFDKTAGTNTADGATYYARKISSTAFSIFTNYDNAVDTSSITGIVDPVASTGTFTSQVGNPPIRITTLDSIKVKEASLAQANRLVTLTNIDTTVTTPGAVNRLMSNIVSSVEITDTASNLNASSVADTKTIASADISTKMVAGAAGAATGKITISGHGFKTGDAVTYSVGTGGTAASGLTIGATYYVGKLGASTDDFVLFSTRAKALGANLATNTTAYNAGTNSFEGLGTLGTGNQVFTSSTLDKTMSAVGRFKDNTGTVGRVTIKGDSNAITAATLNDIATKIKRGDVLNAKSAYAAKAVDISRNLQALYDNNTVTTASHLDEIVVTDGTATGKKGFSLSESFYTALNSVFDAGVDNVSGNNTNKNYSFTVTGASFGNIGNLQNDVNVGTFAVTGATYSDLTTLTNLVDSVSKSKLKTLTTVAITDKADQTTIRNLVNSIGSPTDRAKIKLITA
jgi:hypothetical protein